ncbi:ABC transporter permease subunit [Idiomarina xiamenensis]|uniref:Phosphate ABC transporter permease n=1 Tax=Idiomarina xiamenensis 10-D-4 TaxID=740709 RepID=K2JW67_9GAMM|nr:ABC transporter permease subunit [Idiomarina xiamenensis]EKE87626.1 phosphate ABC transporter permease [Idiomarina xiamenensis 10-D-4]
MASNSSKYLAANRSRLLKDRMARWGVTLGGSMVLIALLMIFFYLLYVVEPIFRSVKVEPLTDFAAPGQGQTLALGMEEQGEIGYRFDDQGLVTFFAVQDKPSQQRQAGQVLLQQQLLDAADITAFDATLPVNNRYVYAMSGGRALIVQPKFSVSFPNNERLIEPYVEVLNDGQPLLIDQQQRQLNQLVYEYDDATMQFAAVTAAGDLLLTRFNANEDFLTGAVTLEASYQQIPFNGVIDELEMTPDLRQLMVRRGERIHVYDVSSDGNVSERQLLISDNKAMGKITTVELLAGASSIIIGHDSGKISQWFQVASDEGRNYQFIRSFDSGNSAVKALVVEYYRRTFYSVAADGELNIFHTTSEADLYHQRPAGVAVQQAVIDPRANHLLALSDGRLHLFDVDNEHPEVTWSGLWHEVWYEGYPEPQYTWQSTSGSDDFEPKFSLVPISFGTIKAAAYAMLFAVPIGLAAAVYTAYFMSPSVRKAVKPTVEIMEALPTVILGFLAGLWLAPLVEQYLPGMMAVLVLVPLAIIATAFIWSRLPTHIRSKVSDGRAALLLMPIILLVGYFAFGMSPLIEDWLFDGNVRGYLTNELGITFDQRNSLVVGIAMGFAVIPTIFSIAEDAVFSVPKHLTQGSLALGATPWQTLTRVVLLTASPGIFSAIMMGLGRAVGETMIVLMATGNTPIMDWNIFEGMRTLSANIAVEMPESEVGSSHYRILFLAAFVLFIFTFIFNTAAEFVRQRLRDKYSSM